MLPTFGGLKGRNPNKHLQEFHVVCLDMKPKDVTDKQIYWVIDAYVEGSLMNKTMNEEKDLILNMPTNSQQFGNRETRATYKVNKIS